MNGGLRTNWKLHPVTIVALLVMLIFFTTMNFRYVYADPIYILGWPLKFYWSVRPYDADTRAGGVAEALVASIDAVITGAALVCIAKLCEWRLRRR